MPVEIKRRLAKYVNGVRMWTHPVYKIYSPEEAKAHGFDSISWRSATDAGQVVHDDAGWVSTTIRVQTYLVGRRKKSEVTRVVLPYGRFYQNSKHKLDYSKVKDLPKKKWSAVEARKGRTRRMVKVYASMYLEKSGKLTEEDYHHLGIIHRNDQKNPSASVKRVLRIGEVQTMVAKELASLLSKQGLTPGEILSRYDTVYGEAMADGQLNVAKGVLDKLSDMLDMKPTQTKVESGWEFEGEIEMPALESQEQPLELASEEPALLEVSNGDDEQHSGRTVDWSPADGQA